MEGTGAIDDYDIESAHASSEDLERYVPKKKTSIRSVSAKRFQITAESSSGFKSS
jgi:hypothetical protein